MGYYEDVRAELQQTISEWHEVREQAQEYLEHIRDQKKDLEQIIKERQIGFPTLASAFEYYQQLQDQNLVDFLKYKHVPAVRASEVVANMARERRRAISDKKILEYLVAYYESVAPFLIDLKEEVDNISEEDRRILADYSEEELEDKVTNYVSKKEYRKLSTTERNQLALDRYWSRPKSKWQIGKMYERYVGYTYESKGYEVEYVGIFKGLEDLGRDIIASKENEIVVVQCKNWSKFKVIYEKHIFQFFGTVFQYRDANKGRSVKAVFATSTTLSDLAKRFAKELKIELKENFKMNKNYPCIKCNISNKRDKIYHLPFDQQYDKAKITPKRGEFYAKTVKEAEDAGFRRAYRWRGPAQA
ncbi:restriction endonuclease [Patescibacteria group bacterium]|nr:MAG: restriction endonuclease [Patescibacteria group bacterium]